MGRRGEGRQDGEEGVRGERRGGGGEGREDGQDEVRGERMGRRG